VQREKRENKRMLTSRREVLVVAMKAQLPFHQSLGFSSHHGDVLDRHLDALAVRAARVGSDVAAQVLVETTSHDGSTLARRILHGARTGLATRLITDGTTSLVEGRRTSLTKHPGVEGVDALLQGNLTAVLHVIGQADQSDAVGWKDQKERSE
jgi:hypothetical protein